MKAFGYPANKNRIIILFTDSAEFLDDNDCTSVMCMTLWRSFIISNFCARDIKTMRLTNIKAEKTGS